MRFTKMQGIGNDYVYINTMEETVADPSALAVRMSRPHYGVGADGLILIGKNEAGEFTMREFNADGSESEMCGNGSRCVARYLYDRGYALSEEIALRTGAGLIRVHVIPDAQTGKASRVRVDMGVPELRPERVPVNTEARCEEGVPVTAAGQRFLAHCVSMGNPHAVIFVEDVGRVPITVLGPALEHHPVFPRRANIEFIHVTDREHLEMRVWERGSGETLACGTGACAALVAACLTGRSGRSAEIALRGGALRVSWESDGHVYQEGPAEFVFEGEWPEEKNLSS